MIRELRPLLWFIVGVLLASNTVLAFAGLCDPIPKYTVITVDSGQVKPYSSTASKEVVCSLVDWGGGFVYEAPNSCKRIATEYRAPINFELICPNTGQPPVNGKCDCDDKCKPMKDRDVDNGFVGPESTRLDLSFPSRPDDNYVGQEICSMNCRALVTKEVGATGVGYGGRYYGTFNAKFDGTSCQVDKPDTSKDTDPNKMYPKDSEEKKCVDKGMGFGYVNGNVMCVKPDSVKGKDTKTTTQNNPDGTKTQTETKTTLSCDGAVCIETTTTTTTIFNSDGTVKDVKTDEKKTQKDNPNTPNKPPGEGSTFCQENPSSPLCKDGSFSGACGSEPACSGDPVQCATAKAVFEANCKTLKPGIPTEGEPVGERKIQMNFNTVTLTASGSCPADKTVVIKGFTIRFPFSALCELAAGVRPVVIALGWLIAGFIVFGYGKKQGS